MRQVFDEAIYGAVLRAVCVAVRVELPTSARWMNKIASPQHASTVAKLHQTHDRQSNLALAGHVVGENDRRLQSPTRLLGYPDRTTESRYVSS